MSDLSIVATNIDRFGRAKGGIELSREKSDVCANRVTGGSKDRNMTPLVSSPFDIVERARSGNREYANLGLIVIQSFLNSNHLFERDVGQDNDRLYTNGQCDFTREYERRTSCESS